MSSFEATISTLVKVRYSQLLTPSGPCRLNLCHDKDIPIECFSVSFAAPALGQSWRADADYPRKALREGREGTAKFRLDISDRGKVTGCEIIESTGWEDLDEETCRLLPKKARFMPAKDASGRPIPDNYYGSITWRLPR